MNIRQLKDSELLYQIKEYVQSERDLVIKILHHLREIERRRLFSDLGYKSLFDYAVKELKYSEGQANRRIQAMRLLKDLPELEVKIATGALSLSNVQQAQSFFREVQVAEPLRLVSPEEKLEVLAKLEHKSFRDAQKELLKINPASALPKEKERLVTETTSEVRFLMTDKLKAKLEEVRSLLGPKGAKMNYAELFEAMSDISLAALETEKFGKKRSAQSMQMKTTADGVMSRDSDNNSAARKTANEPAPQETANKSASQETNKTVSQRFADELYKKRALDSTSKLIASKNPRYVSKDLKHQVWKRDKGACTSCGGRRNLNYDHIRPVALGGLSTLSNLRLLCFHCNQRASAKIFGEYDLKRRGGLKTELRP